MGWFGFALRRVVGERSWTGLCQRARKLLLFTKLFYTQLKIKITERKYLEKKHITLRVFIVFSFLHKHSRHFSTFSFPFFSFWFWLSVKSILPQCHRYSCCYATHFVILFSVDRTTEPPLDDTTWLDSTQFCTPLPHHTQSIDTRSPQHHTTLTHIRRYTWYI